MKSVSIIIPVRNAEQFIAACLSALQALDYPKEKLDIVLMDNGSTDKTREIAAKFSVKVFIERDVTISRLRNAGASRTSGEILAFVDADCVVPKHWLRAAVEFLEVPSHGAVGCWYALPATPTFVEKVWDLHAGRRREIVGDIAWVPSGDLIMPRRIFDEIKGFDEALTTSEDVDICRRIRQTGRQVFSHPSLAVEHLGNPKTLAEFIKKEKWRGEGVLQGLIQEFPKVKVSSAFIFTVVTAFFLINIIIGIFCWVGGGGNTLLGVSLAGLLVIPVYLTLRAMRQVNDWPYFTPLTFLFLIYGISRILSVFSSKVWRLKYARKI